MTLSDRILALDDADSRRILTTFVKHQPGYQDFPLTPELREALGGVSSVAVLMATEGELARSALRLLADDTPDVEVLEALVHGPSPQQYGMMETAFLVSSVLFVLQTRIRMTRDKDGRWTLVVEKKPTDTALLKELVAKLLSLRI